MNTNYYIISASQTKSVTITNTTFRDLYPVKPSPLYFKDVPNGATGFVLIEDSTFINCSVPSSIVTVEKNGINLTMSRVKMINITKSTTVAEDSQYASEWTGGLCALSRNDAMVTVLNSNFTSISYHCLGIKGSALNITGSNFTNSDYTKPVLTSSLLNTLNDKSGISWVIVEDVSSVVTDSTKVILTGNRFSSNNGKSKYGGVNNNFYTGL